MKAAASEMAFFQGGGWFLEALGQLFCSKFALISAPPDACGAKKKDPITYKKALVYKLLVR